MVILGILTIGFGILMLVARDFFWTLTEMSNSMAGRQSERTELWEMGQVISGLIVIGIGAFVVCSGSAQDAEREQQRVAPTQTAVAIAATASWFDAEYGDLVREWEEVATEEVVHVRPASVGIDASDIYYGRCDNGAFFIALYEMNRRSSNSYLYLPESEPDRCHIDNLRVHSNGGARPLWKVTMFVNEGPRFPSLQATVDALTTRQPDATATEWAVITATHARTLAPRLTATLDTVATQAATPTPSRAPGS